jgi:hypothetical protein
MTDAPIDFRILAGAGAPVREFKSGEVIFGEGDPAGEFFVVQSSEVEIRRGNRHLETLSQYGIFGETADRCVAAKRDRGGDDRREACRRRLAAVSVSDWQYAEFCAQRHAHHGTAAARNDEKCVNIRSAHNAVHRCGSTAARD